MSKKRVLLGLSIIAGGVCASLPFRRETPLSLPSSADSSAALPLEPVSPVKEKPPAAATPPEPTVTPLPESPSPYLVDGTRRLEMENAKHIQPVPPLEEITAHSSEASSSLPMLPVSFQVKTPEVSDPLPWQPARLPEGPAGPPREYRLRKQDTLEDLAERFLGSKDRAEELFAANRDVLKDRHILPIGATIRIPSGGPDSSSGSEGSDLQPVRPASDR